jgi:hypothetical protein
MLEAVFEPVLIRFKTDQNAGGLAVTGDNDFLRLRLPKIPRQPRQIILYFREPDFRTVRAMSRPPIWLGPPKSRRLFRVTTPWADARAGGRCGCVSLCILMHMTAGFAYPHEH